MKMNYGIPTKIFFCSSRENTNLDLLKTPQRELKAPCLLTIFICTHRTYKFFVDSKVHWPVINYESSRNVDFH